MDEMGIRVANWLPMRHVTKSNRASGRLAESVGIVRWVFFRGSKTLTCEVRVNGERAHEVCIVPHWNVSASVIECFDRPWSALRRHAEIAREFRTAGWAMAHEPTH
jgi:hypothetical protein